MRKEKLIYSGSVNKVKFYKSSSLKWKQRKAVHSLQVHELEWDHGVIHRHLTWAPLSWNINILQDCEFMSANKTMLKQNTNHLFSQETDRNWIATSWGQKMDGVWKDAKNKLVEFIRFLLCFHFAHCGKVFALCIADNNNMTFGGHI